jgi:hypothetical protein
MCILLLVCSRWEVGNEKQLGHVYEGVGKAV